ncbi:MAG: glucokinase [Alphaproteobacteria bacterium]|nr:glucokinase [Alphaproteobacteria bacterium]
MTTASGLIADIGGTNARFALAGPDGQPTRARVLKCADHPGPAEAALAYLQGVDPADRPRRGAFAVASPVLGDEVDLTNHVWRFSVEETRARLGLDALTVVNDFSAVAMSVRALGPSSLVLAGGGLAVPDTPMAVLGPGTGLGVSALVPAPGDLWVPLATEGGHVTMAAANEKEEAVLSVLRTQFDHVSAERVLSGPGLVNLHSALCELANRPAEPLSPAVITERALAGSDPLCQETLDVFFEMLGTVAGNLVLSLGARGGLFIAGGIVPQLLQAFLLSGFRKRFEDKGRFQTYLAPIPAWVVTHPYPAFVGLATLV